MSKQGLSMLQINNETMEVFAPVMISNLIGLYHEHLLEGLGSFLAMEGPDMNKYEAYMKDVEDTVKRVNANLEMIDENRPKDERDEVLEPSIACINAGSVVNYMEQTMFSDVLAYVLTAKTANENKVITIIKQVLEYNNNQADKPKDINSEEYKKNMHKTIVQHMMGLIALGKLLVKSSEAVLAIKSDMPEVTLRREFEDKAMESLVNAITDKFIKPMLKIRPMMNTAHNLAVDIMKKKGIKNPAEYIKKDFISMPKSSKDIN